MNPSSEPGHAGSAPLRLAMLSPIEWRTPPADYGPVQRMVSVLTERLVRRGIDVTLFATADSATSARVCSVSPRGYEEDLALDVEVADCSHVSALFERAGEFDLIHSHMGFLPLTYSRLVPTPVVTTIHAVAPEASRDVYERYNGHVRYVAVSRASRVARLDYVATIRYGIDLERFTFQSAADEYLLFLGAIRPDQGVREAIEIARRADRPLMIVGRVLDPDYHASEVLPHVDGVRIRYLGTVGARHRDELLGRAFALLRPRLSDESSGLSALEAMACGTPVVAFERGSMGELIPSGVCGFLVHSVAEAVDALQQVTGIDRRACRRHVGEYFTADRMVEDYLDVYRQVLHRPEIGANGGSARDTESRTLSGQRVA